MVCFQEDVNQRVQRQLDKFCPTEHKLNATPTKNPPRTCPRDGRFSALSASLVILSSLYLSCTRLCLPRISLLYSIPHYKTPSSPFSHHESQCLEPAPICHLIIVPRCHDPFILPSISESNTFPNLLWNSTGKCKWHFGGPGRC